MKRWLKENQEYLHFYAAKTMYVPPIFQFILVTRKKRRQSYNRNYTYLFCRQEFLQNILHVLYTYIIDKAVTQYP